MTIDDLMAQPATSDKDSPSIGARLAELTYKNGGTPTVRGWGMLQIGVGPYGQVGLVESEALELVHLGGLIRGFGLAHPNPRAIDREVVEWIRREWDREMDARGFQREADRS